MSKAERTSLFEKEKRGRELTFLSVYYMLGAMLRASWSQWTVLFEPEVVKISTSSPKS